MVILTYFFIMFVQKYNRWKYSFALSTHQNYLIVVDDKYLQKIHKMIAYKKLCPIVKVPIGINVTIYPRFRYFWFHGFSHQ